MLYVMVKVYIVFYRWRNKNVQSSKEGGRNIDTLWKTSHNYSNSSLVHRPLENVNSANSENRYENMRSVAPMHINRENTNRNEQQMRMEANYEYEVNAHHVDDENPYDVIQDVVSGRRIIPEDEGTYVAISEYEYENQMPRDWYQILQCGVLSISKLSLCSFFISRKNVRVFVHVVSMQNFISKLQNYCLTHSCKILLKEWKSFKAR